MVVISGSVNLDLLGGIASVLKARKVQVRIESGTSSWALLELVELDKDGRFEVIKEAPKRAGQYVIKAQVDISGLTAKDTARLEVRGSEGMVVNQGQLIGVGLTASLGAVGAAAAVGGTDLGRWKFFALLAPLYTRLKKDSVLDHFERGRIFEYINKNPGSHYTDIKVNLDLNNGALAYHLRVLERESYIKSRTIGLFRRFYPFGFRVETQDFVPIQDLLVATVRSSPGIGQKEMARAIGVPLSTVNYQCNMLVRSGEIRSEKMGRKKRYWPEEDN